MRFRSVLVVVSLCLMLGSSAAFAAEAPSRGREQRLSSFLSQLGVFLRTVWENEAGHIDPWGRTSPETGEGDAPATPGADEGIEIDPLG